MNNAVVYSEKIFSNKMLNYSKRRFLKDIIHCSKETGYCVENNEYFAKRYGVHERTIRNWLIGLKESGYITITYVRNNKALRQIKICKTILAKPPKKKKRKYISVLQAVMDDESLNVNVKTFYRDISKMCRIKGYCWAYNKYFAERYQVSERTIGRWIVELVKRGYITSEIKYGKKIKRRLRVNKAILEIKNKENEINKQFSNTNGNIK